MYAGAAEEKLTTQKIADGIGVPYNHVAKAVLQLRNLGCLDVTRGRFGGTELTEQGRNYSVGQLLRELNPREDIVDCVSDGSHCPLIADCRLRVALRQAREAFYTELDPITVADLLKPRTAGPALLPIPPLPPKQK